MVLKVSVREIVEKIEHILWPWHRKDDDDEGDDGGLNPVLLVPGIGGSILNAVDHKGRKERVWVRLFEADHEFRSKLFSFYDPKTGAVPCFTGPFPWFLANCYVLEVKLSPVIALFLLFRNSVFGFLWFSG